MKNTVFPHKFWRPFLDCMPQLFFRPQYVWFPVYLKGLLIPLWYETLVVSWQNWLFTLFHQSRSVLSPNPITHLRKEYFWHHNATSCTLFEFFLKLLTDPVWKATLHFIAYIDGSAEDCGNSIANALDLPQSCTEPSISVLRNAREPRGWIMDGKNDMHYQDIMCRYLFPKQEIILLDVRYIRHLVDGG